MIPDPIPPIAHLPLPSGRERAPIRPGGPATSPSNPPEALVTQVVNGWRRAMALARRGRHEEAELVLLSAFDEALLAVIDPTRARAVRLEGREALGFSVGALCGLMHSLDRHEAAEAMVAEWRTAVDDYGQIEGGNR